MFPVSLVYIKESIGNKVEPWVVPIYFIFKGIAVVIINFHLLAAFSGGMIQTMSIGYQVHITGYDLFSYRCGLSKHSLSKGRKVELLLCSLYKYDIFM